MKAKKMRAIGFTIREEELPEVVRTGLSGEIVLGFLTANIKSGAVEIELSEDERRALYTNLKQYLRRHPEIPVDVHSRRNELWMERRDF